MQPASPQEGIHSYYHAFGFALLMDISNVQSFRPGNGCGAVVVEIRL
jgi:hypothetical protein